MTTTQEAKDYYRSSGEPDGTKKPYTALALQSASPVIYKREEIRTVAIPHIERLLNMAIPSASMEYPVKLVCLTEGGLQGWDAEYNLGSDRFVKDMAVTVPGEETEALSKITRKHNVYLIGTLKTIEPDIIENRYFNIAFLMNPKGEIILRHFKLQVANVERSTVPHDVWDQYIAKYGDGPDAFFQVADTDIGRIGMTICAEGAYPEIYRSYALQGAEVLSHPDWLTPFVDKGGCDWYGIMQKARAWDNCLYMVCANGGPKYYPQDANLAPYSISGGRSMVVDYRGQVLSELNESIEGFAAATIDIKRLREYRASVKILGLPTLRTEYFRNMYQKPIYAKNAWVNEPSTWKAFDKHLDDSIQALIDQNIYARISD